MAIKMRFLYYSGKAKMKAIAEAGKTEFGLGAANSIDIIPPAYSCDKERLVVLVLTCKGSLKDDVRLFISELKPARAVNVALMIDGNADGDAYVRSLLEGAGTKVCPDTLFINGCNIFNSKISDQEKTEILAWVNNCIASI